MKLFISLLILLLCISYSNGQVKKENGYSFGINVMTIGEVNNRYFTNNTHKQFLLVNDFFLRGGISKKVTPTDISMGYNKDSLFVVFDNCEKGLGYPIGFSHDKDLYSQSFYDQYSIYPDKVDLFIKPILKGKKYYHLTVTKNGRAFWKKVHSSSKRNDKKIPFNYTVANETQKWVVSISLPWTAIGGKPEHSFGILPIRSKWRNGEVSSPVALDLMNTIPAPDSYIETSLGSIPKVFKTNQLVAKLPSGVRRWVRPAKLKYPSQRIVEKVYELQRSNASTTSNNFIKRIHLIQAWTDLIILEGFNFGANRGSVVLENLYPYKLRISVNNALQHLNKRKAYSLLDNYLVRLRKVTKKWFADGSVGNIKNEVWERVERVERVEILPEKITFRCLTEGNHKIALNLSFPVFGGIHLWANKKGFFQPDSLLKIDAKKINDSYVLKSGKATVKIRLEPFSFTFCDLTSNTKKKIKGNNIAFLFNKGSIEAFDFKNSLSVDEGIYGFGERYDRLNQKGHIITLWGMDDWFGNTIGLQNETYKPIPLFHSTKGYSVFVNSSYRLRADIGKTISNQYRLTQQGSVFDFYFWLTPPFESIQSYTTLTGKPLLPPKWAFEPWMGRTGKAWSHNHTIDPVEEQIRVTKQFENLDIPHSAIYAEGDGSASPALYSYMNPKNIHVLSWFYSEISEVEQQKLMPELTSKDLPLLKFEKNEKSKSHQISYVDFTNPNALELSRRWWKSRLDLGLAGSMVDFGDRVPEDAIFYNGKLGDEMHNRYAYIYHKTYSKVFKERRGDDYILFARSAAPGDQKWIGQFSGDHSANFKGMKGELLGGLNLCSTGFSNWGTQLGGHWGWPDPLVYMRWTAFSSFNPLMRAHGMTPREPWKYGQEAVENYKFYAWVRENLLEYIYQEAIFSHQTGIPMMRSIPFSFPNEKGIINVDKQYMFGGDLLVAPVIKDDTSKMVYFPSGKWTNLWTGLRYKGIDSVRMSVPYQSIPVFLKNGAILPVNLDSSLQFGESMTDGKVKALIITPPENLVEKNFHFNPRFITKVQLDSKKGGFIVNIKNYKNLLYLIVYDDNVSEIKVNGKTLHLLENKELKTLPPGWFYDKNIHRAIVRLPYHRSVRIEVYY